MKTSTIGPNKTGFRAAPGDSDALLRAVEASEPTAPAAASAADALRLLYFRDAEPLGSVPPPDTMRGVVKTGATMMRGTRMQALMDKLGERLAFERSGTRLYEAFVRKCRFLAEDAGPIDLATVERFMREEARHFALVKEAIETLGGDPTAQTPCADVVGVQSMGLMQSVVDPRTTVLQSLHAILAAELVDEAGWALLIALTRDADQDEIAERFETALAEEEEHLRTVREWYEQMSIAEASLGGESATT